MWRACIFEMNYCSERAEGFFFNDLEKLVIVRSARPRGDGSLSPSDIEMALTSTFILVQQRDSQGARFWRKSTCAGLNCPHNSNDLSIYIRRTIYITIFVKKVLEDSTGDKRERRLC